MNKSFDAITVGETITSAPFTASPEGTQNFADASLDYNPLHFDKEYMKGNFGKTNFGGLIMHGMQNFSVISRTLIEWIMERGGCHRRLETRWVKPVNHGDSIVAKAVITDKLKTAKSKWVTFDVNVTNQRGELVAQGQAMAEFPDVFPWGPPKE